jgi:hypothetical protein
MLGEKRKDRKSVAEKARSVPVEDAKAFTLVIEEAIVVSRLLALTYRVALNTKGLPEELKTIINRATLIVVNTDTVLSKSIKYKSRPPVAPQLTDDAVNKLTAVMMVMALKKPDVVLDFIDPEYRTEFLNRIRHMTDEQYQEWLTKNQE